jgi:phosphoribosylanthranilate isomerase
MVESYINSLLPAQFHSEEKMAHFAQLDSNNKVLQVIVVSNEALILSKTSTINEDNSVSVSIVESEDRGITFCKSLFGSDTNWIQTSYSGSFRGKYAGIGDEYNVISNTFVTPVTQE